MGRRGYEFGFAPVLLSGKHDHEDEDENKDEHEHEDEHEDEDKSASKQATAYDGHDKWARREKASFLFPLVPSFLHSFPLLFSLVQETLTTI